MKAINYWDCPFNNYQEEDVYDGEGNWDVSTFYGCCHNKNEDGICKVDNQWDGEEADCDYILTKEEWENS